MVNVFSHNETKILLISLISLFGAKFEVLTYDSNFTVDKFRFSPVDEYNRGCLNRGELG